MAFPQHFGKKNPKPKPLLTLSSNAFEGGGVVGEVLFLFGNLALGLHREAMLTFGVLKNQG